MDECIINPLSSVVILSVFVKQVVVFFVSHIGVTHVAFESHGGSICVTFCDATPLSEKTAYSRITHESQAHYTMESATGFVCFQILTMVITVLCSVPETQSLI